MTYSFVIEPVVFQPFGDEEAELVQAKDWGLLSEKAAKTKSYLYKGNGLHITCKLVGYADRLTAVIELDNGQRHCIHPAYLKEMQAAQFGRRPVGAFDTEAETADTETDSGNEDSDEQTAASKQERKSGTGAAAKDRDDSGNEAHTEEAGASGSMTDLFGTVADEQAQKANQPPAAASADSAKAKPKRTKVKLALPEEKVKMSAIVDAFSTVPNHFADRDDEVVIYRDVTIEDPELTVGDAWSSYSATLKKLEIAVGDHLTFDAKVAVKKLAKHPVQYKINNPSKIVRQAADAE